MLMDAHILFRDDDGQVKLTEEAREVANRAADNVSVNSDEGQQIVGRHQRNEQPLYNRFNL